MTYRKEYHRTYYLKNRDKILRYSKEWSLKNRDKKLQTKRDYYLRNKSEIKEYNFERRSRRRELLLKRLYGISLSGYALMLKEQNGACAICKGQNLDGKNLYVDHDHKTGKIRSLLCNSCNIFVGQIENKLALLPKVLEYIS